MDVSAELPDVFTVVFLVFPYRILHPFFSRLCAVYKCTTTTTKAKHKDTITKRNPEKSIAIKQNALVN